MNRTEAADLADLLARTWTGGPAHAVWVAELVDLDLEHGIGAYVALRRTEHEAPSVAVFLAHYYAIAREEQRPLLDRFLTDEEREYGARKLAELRAGLTCRTD